MNLEKIGLFIRNKREEKNLTRIELAKKLNIPTIHIKKLETGKKLPDILIIEKLCKILEISVIEFFKGTILDKKQTEENNELLLETLKFANNNNKYINIINKFLIITFLFVTVIFGYLNCKMMYYQNKYYYANENINVHNKQIDNINTKFELIEKNKDKFNEEFYTDIMMLKEKYNLLLNDKKLVSLMTNKTKYKLSEIRDLVNLYLQHDSVLSSREYENVEIDIYKNMIKGDSKYVDNLLKYDMIIYMSKMQYSDSILEINNAKETYKKIDPYLAKKAQYMYIFKLNSVELVLDDIIKVGELDEQ